MSRILGTCPNCKKGSVTFQLKDVQGRKTKVYSCSNYKVFSEDGEMFENVPGYDCNFKIFGNAFAKWGKKFIGPNEITKLLKGEDVIGHFYSYQKKVEYYKYILLDFEYGVSVDWETNVDKEEDAS